VIGALSLECGRARTFSGKDIATVKAVAGVFEKILEIEQLKHDLRLTQDSLDLTQAVVEDSLLESQTSRLPNLRFLNVWTKAVLFLARRSGEPMALVRWRMALTPASLEALETVADALRGEDLLVDMGKEEFLLLLPRTNRAGAEVLLGRIRPILGPVPMGATLWSPDLPADRDDLDLHDALKRTQVGLQWSHEATREGIVDRMGTLGQLLLEEFGVSWELIEAKPGNKVEPSHTRREPALPMVHGTEPGGRRPRSRAGGQRWLGLPMAPASNAPLLPAPREQTEPTRSSDHGFRVVVPEFS